MTSVTYREYTRIPISEFLDDLMAHHWGSRRAAAANFAIEGRNFLYHPANWGRTDARPGTWSVVLADPHGKLWVCRAPLGAPWEALYNCCPPGSANARVPSEYLPALRAAIPWDDEPETGRD